MPCAAHRPNSSGPVASLQPATARAAMTSAGRECLTLRIPCDARAKSPRYADGEIAILDGPVVALQHDRPRLAFITIQRAARRAGDLGVTDDALAVHHHRHAPPDQGDVEHLPF